MWKTEKPVPRERGRERERGGGGGQKWQHEGSLLD